MNIGAQLQAKLRLSTPGLPVELGDLPRQKPVSQDKVQPCTESHQTNIGLLLLVQKTRGSLESWNTTSRPLDLLLSPWVCSLLQFSVTLFALYLSYFLVAKWSLHAFTECSENTL